MDGPYRSAPVEEEASPPRDAGIVGEVIGQFADPLAFYRELVQNAIDAGTPEVVVRIAHDEAEQVARVSVRDQGEGMDRDVLENQLLVLFRSTKEGDAGKIGKFGIGFASVLAPGPRAVTVTTARAGARLAVHLYPDLRYELFDLGPATGAGTTVQLELPLEAAGLDAFVRDSRAALVRWCRHAACAIRLITPAGEERIDRPLAIDGAVVSVRRELDDGALVVVVGITDPVAPYAGFFNHGLTLHEPAEPMLGALAFKVQDARLGHTLSRDNVRRDAAFERALAAVRRIAADDLPGAAVAELAHRARTARDGYPALALAIASAKLEVPPGRWPVPLVDPPGGDVELEEVVTVGPLLGARASSPLTTALAAAGKRVIDLTATGLADDPRLQQALEAAWGELPVHVDLTYTLIAPVDPTPADQELLAELGDVLAAAHRRPQAIALAELDGRFAGDLAVSGAAGVWHGEHVRRSPFGVLRRRPLVLSVRHPHVASARRAASGGGAVAAAGLLARAILLGFGLLDERRSQALLAHGLARAGVA